MNAKPRPGAHLQLIATITTQVPSAATAIVKNTATGETHTLGLNDVIAGFHVAEIQRKQILLQREGEPAIWKFMKPTFLK
ncbi:MAG: hypothetical protein OXI24_21125 [Candidatus Poribacteria bacterium]|nr:hypothetical protein [Candidatus Poribacteria bacterium]